MLKAAYKGIYKPNKINIEIYEDYACILLNFVVYYISLNSKAVISDRLQQHLIRTGIEVVITALTRNHSKYCAVLTIRTARKPR